MAFRFFRRFRVVPGISVNLSKSGVSLSLGPRGAKVTVGPRGARGTVGIPGTGLYYTATGTAGSRKRRVRRAAALEPQPPVSTTGGDWTTRWNAVKGQGATSAAGSSPRRRRRAAVVEPGSPVVGAQPVGGVKRRKDTAEGESETRAAQEVLRSYMQRSTTSDDEKEFLNGCRELMLGNVDAAFEHWRGVAHLVDASYMAGFMALKTKRAEEAIRYLEPPAQRHAELGESFAEYKINVDLVLPITPEIAAHVGVSLSGVLLGLVEAYQMVGRLKDAVDCLCRLRERDPQDVVVKLSLAELLWEMGASESHRCEEIVRLGEGIRNETDIHATLLLYKAKALRELGQLNSALEVVRDLLGFRGNRPEDLVRAIRYEEALIYEAKGDAKRARVELERLYAESPGYEDVAVRLGRRPDDDWTSGWSAVKGRGD